MNSEKDVYIYDHKEWNLYKIKLIKGCLMETLNTLYDDIPDALILFSENAEDEIDRILINFFIRTSPLECSVKEPYNIKSTYNHVYGICQNYMLGEIGNSVRWCLPASQQEKGYQLSDEESKGILNKALSIVEKSTILENYIKNS